MTKQCTSSIATEAPRITSGRPNNSQSAMMSYKARGRRASRPVAAMKVAAGRTARHLKASDRSTATRAPGVAQRNCSDGQPHGSRATKLSNCHLQLIPIAEFDPACLGFVPKRQRKRAVVWTCRIEGAMKSTEAAKQRLTRRVRGPILSSKKKLVDLLNGQRMRLWRSTRSAACRAVRPTNMTDPDAYKLGPADACSTTGEKLLQATAK